MGIVQQERKFGMNAVLAPCSATIHPHAGCTSTRIVSAISRSTDSSVNPTLSAAKITDLPTLGLPTRRTGPDPRINSGYALTRHGIGLCHDYTDSLAPSE
jgi:hypothetical protein